LTKRRILHKEPTPSPVRLATRNTNDTRPNLFPEQLSTNPLGIFEQVRDNGGRVRPHEGPGIGIALKEEFVTKYRVA
jgi:L-alanine-DL-glutamate epimerase-like enolase superfamily enzyme